MIIKRLTLYNFGIYAGENTFLFEGDKPIVLIGGLNGRGKTTFLSAILISLYGENSYTYKESSYSSYGQYLRSYVHKGSWDQTAYLELEFSNTGSDCAEYLIRREWDALGKRTREKIYVKKNGISDEFLTENWPMFVESILPSALAGFYFFDGEKIAEMAVDTTSPQLKESIRAMLGITVLDVLNNDVLRILRKIKRSSKGDTKKSSDGLELLRDQKENAERELAELDRQISEIFKKIEYKRTEIEDAYHQYDSQGGTALEKRDELNKKRAELQSEIDKTEEGLYEAAASILPLKLISELLCDIKLTAQDEHNEYVLQEAMDQIEELLDQFMKSDSSAAAGGKEFYNYLRKKVESYSAKSVYSLSDQALFQITDIVETRLKVVSIAVKERILKKKELKAKLEETNSFLQLDINEKGIEKIRDQIRMLEEERVKLEVDLRSLQNNRSSVNATVITKTAEFNKYVEAYLRETELTDDTQRTAKYANLAIQILEKYTIALQARKTGILGDTITSCYKQLANKTNLIDQVRVDSETLEIRYYNSQGKEVEKTSLSAGEKQLMVVSILWALAICSQKKLPVIIDTPLSRMDSLHRNALITTYFPQASDQTIILSTDSEIDQSGYELMKANIGDEFTLQYNETEKSTTIQKGYFVEGI